MNPDRLSGRFEEEKMDHPVPMGNVVSSRRVYRTLVVFAATWSSLSCEGASRGTECFSADDCGKEGRCSNGTCMYRDEGTDSPPETGVASDAGGDSETADVHTDGTSSNSRDTDAPPPGCEGALAFSDPALETVVRRMVGKPSSALYYDDVKGIHELEAQAKDIRDLTGIECLNNLTALALAANPLENIQGLAGLTRLMLLDLYATDISDIAPIAELSHLVELHLAGNNIVDIRALRGLTELTNLSLSFNPIEDISALSNLRQLTSLDLTTHVLVDIRPLSELTEMTYLLLSFNRIRDISPLARMTQLEELLIVDNCISDISPLVDNEGLSGGDWVLISDNPLDCGDPQTSADIEALENRGVDITHDCRL